MTFNGPILLLSLIMKNGHLRMSRFPILAAYIMKSFLSYPFFIYESIFLEKRMEQIEIDDPIFILGHFRSGTTYLQKLMSADSHLGSIRLYDVFFPYVPRWFESIIKPFLQYAINTIGINHPFFNDYIIDLNDPHEEDAYLISTVSRHSAYWGFLFPKNMMKYLCLYNSFENDRELQTWKKSYLFTIRKFVYRTKKQKLLLKSPPNTARVEVLRSIFPNAKYVFIHRNPYEVFYSMYHMLKNITEKFYALQEITDGERERAIFDYYRFILEKYEKEKKVIPTANLVEIKYEDLLENPLEQIRGIYRKLNLPGFSSQKRRLVEKISREKTYKTVKYVMDKKTIDKINLNWLDLLQTLGYAELH